MIPEELQERAYRDFLGALEFYKNKWKKDKHLTEENYKKLIQSINLLKRLDKDLPILSNQIIILNKLLDFIGKNKDYFSPIIEAILRTFKADIIRLQGKGLLTG